MDETLNQAVSYIKVGEKEKAKRLLIQVLKDNPKNELAWLWMTRCVATREQKTECYKRVLDINPDNKFAQDGLKKLDTQTSLDGVSKHPSQSTPQPNNKISSSNLKTILILAVILVCLCSLPIMLLVSNKGARRNVNTGSSGASNFVTSVPVIIDVSSLFGKPLSEIRATYSVTEYEELHPLFGYEDILPRGVFSEGYTLGNYSFYIFYDEGQESVGFQMYDGLESRHLSVKDWKEILKMLNLNVTKSPNLINDMRAEWNNYMGYHIEVVSNISSDYAAVVIILKP